MKNPALNKTVLTGEILLRPELGYAKSGTVFCTLKLRPAYNEYPIKINVFGRIAERCSYLERKDVIYIEGKLKGDGKFTNLQVEDFCVLGKLETGSDELIDFIKEGE